MLAAAAAAADSTPPPPPFVYSIGGLSTPLTLCLTAIFVFVIITFFLAFFFCCHITLNPRSQNPSPDQAAAAVEGEEYREHRGVPGLDETVISSYPKLSFSVNGSGDGLCPICLNEYKEGQMLRKMPECRHCFHVLCIDSWLRRRGTCPVCRSTPAPTKSSSPVTELLSLSQDSGERLRG